MHFSPGKHSIRVKLLPYTSFRNILHNSRSTRMIDLIFVLLMYCLFSQSDKLSHVASPAASGLHQRSEQNDII